MAPVLKNQIQKQQEQQLNGNTVQISNVVTPITTTAIASSASRNVANCGLLQSTRNQEEQPVRRVLNCAVKSHPVDTTVLANGTTGITSAININQNHQLQQPQQLQQANQLLYQQQQQQKKKQKQQRDNTAPTATSGNVNSNVSNNGVTFMSANMPTLVLPSSNATATSGNKVAINSNTSRALFVTNSANQTNAPPSFKSRVQKIASFSNNIIEQQCTQSNAHKVQTINNRNVAFVQNRVLVQNNVSGLKTKTIATPTSAATVPNTPAEQIVTDNNINTNTNSNNNSNNSKSNSNNNNDNKNNNNNNYNIANNNSNNMNINKTCVRYFAQIGQQQQLLQKQQQQQQQQPVQQQQLHLTRHNKGIISSANAVSKTQYIILTKNGPKPITTDATPSLPNYLPRKPLKPQTQQQQQTVLPELQSVISKNSNSNISMGANYLYESITSNTQLELKREPKLEPEPESQLQVDGGPDTDTEAELELEMGLEPESKPLQQLDAESQSVSEPKLTQEIGVEQKLEPQGELKTELKLDLKSETERGAGEKDSELCHAMQQNTETENNENEVDIVINNVVCSFSVRCHLNLREIALNGANVEYRRENGMVTMKLRRPYTTASIWSSGRITCTGATSEKQAYIAARRYARSLYKLGFPVRFQNFRIVNVLGTCSMPWAIKIVNFSSHHRHSASYEPELHPGVTYKIRDPKATLKIFSTGSITITAASVAHVQAAIEHIYPLLYEHRKERTPEEITQLRLKQKLLLVDPYETDDIVNEADKQKDGAATSPTNPVTVKQNEPDTCQIINVTANSSTTNDTSNNSSSVVTNYSAMSTRTISSNTNASTNCSSMSSGLSARRRAAEAWASKLHIKRPCNVDVRCGSNAYIPLGSKDKFGIDNNDNAATIKPIPKTSTFDTDNIDKIDKNN